MESTTSLVARQYRLHEWAAQIAECNNRPSNLTVKEWCSQHHITVADYYYRLRQVRKACLENLPAESPTSQSVIPLPSELMTGASLFFLKSKRNWEVFLQMLVHFLQKN